MILFTVMHRCDSMRVCSKFMEFSGFLVRITWHDMTSPQLHFSRLAPAGRFSF